MGIATIKLTLVKLQSFVCLRFFRTRQSGISSNLSINLDVKLTLTETPEAVSICELYFLFF